MENNFSEVLKMRKFDFSYNPHGHGYADQLVVVHVIAKNLTQAKKLVGKGILARNDLFIFEDKSFDITKGVIYSEYFSGNP